jgi:glycosyltransferase involved in cell wall biosynthesis
VTVGYSVIIPSRDRPADPDACQRSVCQADTGRLAEIVIDDGSRAPVQVDQVPGPVLVHVFRNDTPEGPDKSRNEAAGMAKGDYLVFLDDDARMAHDWFEVASRAVDDGIPVFTGRVLPFDRGLSSRARQWRYDQRYHGMTTGPHVGFFAGGNSVVKRDLFLEVGGFPVQKAGGDNGIVNRLAAAGIPTTFVRELRILHRNGKGLRLAAERAWSSGRRCPSPGPRMSSGAARAAPDGSGTPRPTSPVVNGVLQILHSTGQLMSGINGSFEEGTGSR